MTSKLPSNLGKGGIKRFQKVTPFLAVTDVIEYSELVLNFLNVDAFTNASFSHFYIAEAKCL